MSKKKESKDFAETKHKGLPMKKEALTTKFSYYMSAPQSTSIGVDNAKAQVAAHNQKMYRVSKEYIRTKLRDQPTLQQTEVVTPVSHLEKNAFRGAPKFRFKKFFTGEAAKSTAIGFIAGGIGGNLATAVTYPVDTIQMREQLDQPKAQNIGELYKGIGKKLGKNFLHTGIQMGTIGGTTALAVKLLSRGKKIG